MPFEIVTPHQVGAEAGTRIMLTLLLLEVAKQRCKTPEEFADWSMGVHAQARALAGDLEVAAPTDEPEFEATAREEAQRFIRAVFDGIET